MQELAAVWLLCVLAGTSCAIFYTNSKENDYPRIGKRAFFTMGDKGSSYPRIGRSGSAAATGSDGFPRLRPSFEGPGGAPEDDADNSGVFRHRYNALPAILKRGIFTGGSSGYPRIGRRSGGPVRVAGQGGSGADEDVAAALTSSLERSEDGDDQYAVPLGLLFFSFDENGDKTLSREEFVQGMARAREDGTVCR